MKTLKLAAIMAVLLSACSCVPISSFYPLWDERHAAFEPQLLGEWRDAESRDDGAMSFAESAEKTYLVTYSEKDEKSGKIKKSLYTAKLVRLGKHLFIDFIIDEASFDKLMGKEAYQSLVPMHFFNRIELDGDILKIAFLDDERFEKKVSKKEIDLPLLKRKNIILLTAETAKIQQVLERFAEDKDLWGEFTVMHRKSK
jgi:hypothetical protein